MPRAKKVVQIAARSGKQVLREPEAPADLWEQMDVLHSRAGMTNGVIERPEGSFTALEYAKKYNVSQTRGRCRLRELLESGHIVYLGMGRDQTRYYKPVQKS